MPAMLRPKGKPTKIAYSILGEPINIRGKPKNNQKREKQLVFEETSIAR